MKFNMYPIHGVSRDFGEEQFDVSRLPIQISDGVSIESVASQFRDGAFDVWKEMIGSSTYDALMNIQYAFLHRYEPNSRNHPLSEAESDRESQHLVRLYDACLRLIRPMRQSAFLIHGEIQRNGKFDVHGFDSIPAGFIEVPEAQKLFRLRNKDVDDLKAYAPQFLRGMRGEFWKFRTAVQYHQLGHFQSTDPNARYLLWCSAIESIYTSHRREHQGSLVAKSRVKWFLGAETKIYDPPHPWDRCQSSPLAVGQVLDDLYILRNYIAHGDRVPRRFFEPVRQSIGGPVRRVEVLTETASFIIRNSLLKILRDGLLEHFSDAGPAETYFGSHELTRSALQKGLRAT